MSVLTGQGNVPAVADETSLLGVEPPQPLVLGAQQQVAMDSGPCQIVQWPNHEISEGLTEMNWFMDQTKPEVIVISGSSRDWTNSRQSLMGAAHLGGMRNITVLENYNGRYVEIFWDGNEYTAAVER